MSDKTQIKEVDPAISRAISSGNIPNEDKDKVRILVVTKAPYQDPKKRMWFLDLKCPCKKSTTREFEEKPSGSFTIECDGCHEFGVVSIE